MPAGYSGTPLARKLGIRDGLTVWLVGAPDDYLTLVEPLPTGVVFVTSPNPDVDLVHFFVKSRHELHSTLEAFRKSLRPDSVVWVSWPKKASKVPTDITEDTIREVALPMGFVDVKVCAVNEIWSGLKLVVRKALR